MEGIEAYGSASSTYVPPDSPSSTPAPAPAPHTPHLRSRIDKAVPGSSARRIAGLPKGNEGTPTAVASGRRLRSGKKKEVVIVATDGNGVEGDGDDDVDGNEDGDGSPKGKQADKKGKSKANQKRKAHNSPPTPPLPDITRSQRFDLLSTPSHSHHAPLPSPSPTKKPRQGLLLTEKDQKRIDEERRLFLMKYGFEKVEEQDEFMAGYRELDDLERGRGVEYAGQRNPSTPGSLKLSALTLHKNAIPGSAKILPAPTLVLPSGLIPAPIPRFQSSSKHQSDSNLLTSKQGKPRKSRPAAAMLMEDDVFSEAGSIGEQQRLKLLNDFYHGCIRAEKEKEVLLKNYVVVAKAKARKEAEDAAGEGIEDEGEWEGFYGGNMADFRIRWNRVAEKSMSPGRGNRCSSVL